MLILLPLLQRPCFQTHQSTQTRYAMRRLYHPKRMERESKKKRNEMESVNCTEKWREFEWKLVPSERDEPTTGIAVSATTVRTWMPPRREFSKRGLPSEGATPPENRRATWENPPQRQRGLLMFTAMPGYCQNAGAMTMQQSFALGGVAPLRIPQVSLNLRCTRNTAIPAQ